MRRRYESLWYRSYTRETIKNVFKIADEKVLPLSNIDIGKLSLNNTRFLNKFTIKRANQYWDEIYHLIIPNFVWSHSRSSSLNTHTKYPYSLKRNSYYYIEEGLD